MKKTIRDIVADMLVSRDGALPSTQVFPPVDVESVARQLRLDERGSEQGSQNIPSCDAEVPDTVESSIAAEVERFGRKAHEEYLTQRDLYEGRIRRALIHADQRMTVEAAGQSVIKDFRAEVSNDLDQLYNLREEVVGREAEYQSFRRRHGLTRLPRLRSSREKAFMWLLLTLFLLLESVLNGNFFAEGSEAGLVGGVLQAFVLSVLNIGGSVLYARFGLPLLLHHDRQWRLVGVLALVIFSTWLLGLNLSIGHFRDLFIEGSGNVAMQSLLARLSDSPLLHRDVQSSLLVVFGIALGLLAVIDTRAMRDPYPGYEELGSRMQKAIATYADARERCLSNIQRLRDEAVENMSEAIRMMRDAGYEKELAVEGRSRLHQTYVAYLDHLALVHQRLVGRYRDANRRARTTPPPAFFRHAASPPMLPSVEPLPSMREIDDDLRDDTVARLEFYIRAVNEEFERTLQRYHSVVDLTGSEAAQSVSA